eukprot:CAMPEP_0113612202 /NCGR_PEP_ID=MMETSP0017_2-20120614/5974_2 /TAXON_ID=2856 /ORGANISM="Cylindrotheca closterium" /LENGTH=83 /DNA_ID=CAMNT_0000521221 /DNA_START=232 /DNA_END=483 /DNA_ORIENTATION=- /assembly_acc=CAM_ASM_000147
MGSLLGGVTGDFAGPWTCFLENRLREVALLDDAREVVDLAGDEIFVGMIGTSANLCCCAFLEKRLREAALFVLAVAPLDFCVG